MNWSTFILEIINFLVLVWILKRFLYKPILDVIGRRRAAIEKSLADAKNLHAEAEKLQDQYETRLEDWDHEKQKAREALDREIETEHERKLAELRASLAQETEKTRVMEARRQADARHKIEETALMQGARFATYLLKGSAGAETEKRLAELVLAELERLVPERVKDLRSSYRKTSEDVVVTSAFPLPDELRQRFKKSLTEIVAPGISVRFEQNSELIAGVQIIIGAWVLNANLRDELKGFTELSHGE
jgi:F-type H+-transporting ATPase subunit b